MTNQCSPLKTVARPVTIGWILEGEVDEQRQSQNLRAITGIEFG